MNMHVSTKDNCWKNNEINNESKCNKPKSDIVGATIGFICPLTRPPLRAPLPLRPPVAMQEL